MEEFIGGTADTWDIHVKWCHTVKMGWDYPQKQHQFLLLQILVMKYHRYHLPYQVLQSVRTNQTQYLCRTRTSHIRNIHLSLQQISRRFPHRWPPLDLDELCDHPHVTSDWGYRKNKKRTWQTLNFLFFVVYFKLGLRHSVTFTFFFFLFPEEREM